MAKLEAYIGLELAMSIVKIGNVKSYWGKARFSGHTDFRDTMSRDDFQKIRGSIQFHPPLRESKEKENDDPLWHSCTLLNHFQLNCANIAVPFGSSALDEASCRTKGRTRAKSYMPSKDRVFRMWAMLPPSLFQLGASSTFELSRLQQ